MLGEAEPAVLPLPVEPLTLPDVVPLLPVVAEPPPDVVPPVAEPLPGVAELLLSVVDGLAEPAAAPLPDEDCEPPWRLSELMHSP